MSHIIPPLEELNRRAYCKFHNTFSHATNDYNVLWKQIQSAVNEGRIIVPQMKVDQNPIPTHTYMLELSNPKVLIRPNQAESAKGKNIIIGEKRSEPSKSHQEAPAKKIPEDSLNNSTLGGQKQKKEPSLRRPVWPVWKPVWPVTLGVLEKNPETIRKKKGRVLKNSWPNMRRKESSRSRRDGQIRLRIWSHHRLKCNWVWAKIIYLMGRLLLGIVGILVIWLWIK